ITLQLELPCFLSVNRVWFGDNLHRCRCWSALHGADMRRSRRRYLGAEGGCLDRAPSVAAAIALSRLRDSVAETSAGHGSLDAFRAAGAVTLSSALRQIE